MTEVKSPVCPVCGEPPRFTLNPEQAFCGNEDGCRLIMWNPTLTASENLAGAETVHFQDRGASHGETGKRA